MGNKDNTTLRGTHGAFKYWWKSTDDKEILKEHIEVLEEDAQNRINEMSDQGYTNGELVSEMYNSNREYVFYRGWWSAK